MKPSLLNVLLGQIGNLQRYATEDPREDVRHVADERLAKALEAVLGMKWGTLEKMAVVYAIRFAAADGKDASSVAATIPELAGHQDKIAAAISGFADDGRRWPAVVDLLEAAGMIEITGGNPRALKRGRQQAAGSLSRAWRDIEAADRRLGGAPYQPFGYRRPEPGTPDS